MLSLIIANINQLSWRDRQPNNSLLRTSTNVHSLASIWPQRGAVQSENQLPKNSQVPVLEYIGQKWLGLHRYDMIQCKTFEEPIRYIFEPSVKAGVHKHRAMRSNAKAGVRRLTHAAWGSATVRPNETMQPASISGQYAISLTTTSVYVISAHACTAPVTESIKHHSARRRSSKLCRRDNSRVVRTVLDYPMG